MVSAMRSGNTSSESLEKDAGRLVRDGIEALDLQWSVKDLPKSKSVDGASGFGGSLKKSAKQRDLDRRRSTRSTGEQIESLTKKLSVLGKRGRKTFEDAGIKATRELRRLADTAEFAKIETKPVIHEVWSNGKLVVAEPSRKKKKVGEEGPKVTAEKEKKKEEPKKLKGKKEKVWLSKGLYAGQEHRNLDWFADSSSASRAESSIVAPYEPNKFMPLPMWHGQRLLHVGRNFKLPFDVCAPLPPGQPKPDEWRKTSSSKYSIYVAARAFR